MARFIIEIATAAQPHLRYVTSDDVHRMVMRKYQDPTGDTAMLYPCSLATRFDAPRMVRGMPFHR